MKKKRRLIQEEYFDAYKIEEPDVDDFIASHREEGFKVTKEGLKEAGETVGWFVNIYKVKPINKRR